MLRYVHYVDNLNVEFTHLIYHVLNIELLRQNFLYYLRWYEPDESSDNYPWVQDVPGGLYPRLRPSRRRVDTFEECV